MPELPEAERARGALETVLGGGSPPSTTATPTFPPARARGDRRRAGRPQLATAHRRGKFLWLETDDGPVLGLHLGMAGRIVVDDGEDVSRWDRFAVEFDDGTRMALRDKRRLGRACSTRTSATSAPTPRASSRDDFRRIIGAGRTAVKARLLNQGAISGVGNLLADQALWQARIAPTRADLEPERRGA